MTTINYAALKIEDIKGMLEEMDVDVDSLELKGKKAWVFYHMELMDNTTDSLLADTEVESEFSHELEPTDTDFLGDVNLTDFEMEEEEPVKVETEDVGPKYTDPEWSDFVMEHFAERELVDGHPKVDGLRRVAELLLGEVIFSGPHQLFPSADHSVNNPGRCSCVYQITIAWSRGVEAYVDPTNYQYPERTFRAAAGSFLGNTDDEFAMFPDAIAETRAEARCLKKALGLKGVTHEELTEKSGSDLREGLRELDAIIGDNGMINGGQIAFLNSKCDALDIDVFKFINKKHFTGETKNVAYEKITDVPHEIAAAMIQELTKYQNVSDDESTEVPSEILKEVE